jgi:4-carboxymuconolactone decarboxylase
LTCQDTGNVTTIPAGVEHWHGAAPGDKFMHIAITNEVRQNLITWLKPVIDTGYETAMLNNEL